MKFKIALLLLLSSLLCSPEVTAQSRAYFGFEPDITTNYIRDASERRLGYIRVSIDLMVPSTEDLRTIEYHAPLLRDAFIRILSTESEGRIRSLTGREEIRQACLETAKELILRETGQDLVLDLLFTKYVYQ
ncbi:flagellar basal body-associated FliL family protein [Aliidiomarina celeris]|uniref:flagellar basal body-associated FliL family protein n=1 Tax=Aliidiomarina celeris TaxID=2249428 RepID=UPI000DE8166C|nr:flagellar basal body-associated FliL family protein [Aliidiomarina celeris]